MAKNEDSQSASAVVKREETHPKDIEDLMDEGTAEIFRRDAQRARKWMLKKSEN